jgi:hypothetical protein
MKAQWGGSIAPRILDLGTRWEWSASRPGRFSPWYPLDRTLGRPQIRSGGDDEKNSMRPPGLEPPIIQPVAQLYTTELSLPH